MFTAISISCAGILIGMSLARMYFEEDSKSNYIFLIWGIVLLLINIPSVLG